MSARTGWCSGALGADFFCSVLVVLGNPVLYRLGGGILAYSSPDASAYATLGRLMASDSVVFLRSWGSVDQGVILPPLLPAFIALGSAWSDDLLQVGVWVSGIAALVAGVAFYTLLSRLGNRVVAVAVVLAAQTGRYHFFYAFAPLTESLFTAVAAWTLVLLLCFGERDHFALGIGLGLGCALVVLARKAGVFVLGACFVWIVLAPVWEQRFAFRSVARRAALALAGFLVLFGPYAALLYAQTGQYPLQPRFRLGEYVVGTDDPAVIAEIARINEANVGADYATIYRSRRLMRKLLPDGSEMYGALWPPPGNTPESASMVHRVLAEAAAQPGTILRRLQRNAGHLQAALGWPLFALFLASSMSPLIHRMFEPIPSRRFMVPAFTWTYLLGVSVVTDLVVRYVVVFVPFAVIQCAAETYALAIRALPRRAPATLVCVLLIAAGVAAMPRHFWSVRFDPTYDRWVAPYAKLREHVTPGEPVFAAAPLDALLLGASFRALPDSSLKQLVSYGRKTGVRWVVLTNLKHDRKQLKMYDENWYLLPSRQRDVFVSGWLEKRAESGRGRYVLYRIRGLLPRSRKGHSEDRP